MIDTWRHDFTHGLRVLAKSRVFAIIAVSSLALGIGASTAIFSVADSLLFKSLPYPDANRIAIVWQRSPGLGVAQDWLSLGQYLDIANENSVFTDVAAAIGASVNLTGGAAPERVDGMRVSSSFFSLFGARAALGRIFGADDDKPGKAPSVILNHGFWRRRFGADRNVIPRIAEVGVDWRMLAFATVVSLATAILFGLAPALRASRVDATATVRTGSGAVTQARSAARTGKALIAGEIAFAMIVLVGAALLVESYRRIADANPGFDPRHVLSLRISLPSSRYKTPDAVSQFYDQLDRDLHALPGVVSVGSNYQLPLSSVALAWEPIGVEGYVPKGANNLIIASSAYISADYLGAMGMPLLAGRIFSQQDNRQSPPVVIVNQNLAARFWPNQSAIGKRIRQGEDSAWRTVVGVVRDNRDYEPLAQPPITAYFPVEQFNIGSRFVVVRTAASIDPTSVTSAAIRAIHSLDADLPAYDVSTMERRLSDSLSRRRLSTALLAAFGVMALLLAAVGIYGGVAYWVEQRTCEIGIRVAIGANQLNVLALIARELAGILGVGMTAGLAAALMLTRLMNGLLFGVTATDLATFAVVSLILALVSVLATLVPARRAMAVQPLVAMRLD